MPATMHRMPPPPTLSMVSTLHSAMSAELCTVFFCSESRLAQALLNNIIIIRVDAVVMGCWCNGQLVVWAFIVILLLSSLWFIWNNSFCQIPARYTSTASNIRNLPIALPLDYSSNGQDKNPPWFCAIVCIIYDKNSVWSLSSWRSSGAIVCTIQLNKIQIYTFLWPVL